MKSACLIAAAFFTAFFAACTAACSPRAPVASSGDENIPKITIVAKRFTEEQKRAYDDEMQRTRTDLVQR